MVSTAATSDADVPVPIKRRIGGLTTVVSGTAAILVDLPMEEPGVPHPIKVTKVRVVNAKIVTRCSGWAAMTDENTIPPKGWF
jgi:hypothetical protein